MAMLLEIKNLTVSFDTANGPFKAVDGEQYPFGQHVAERNFIVTETRQHGLDRMNDADRQINLAQRRIALDVMYRAEEAADHFAVFGCTLQLGNVAFDIRRLVDQGFEKFFQTVAVVDGGGDDRANIHLASPGGFIVQV